MNRNCMMGEKSKGGRVYSEVKPVRILDFISQEMLLKGIMGIF